MRYELLAEKNGYALIQRGEHLQQFAVVSGLDKEKGEWDWTCSYCDFGKYSELTKDEALARMMDSYLDKTDERYIAYGRLREIAAQLISGLVEDGKDEAYEYMCNVMEITEGEAEKLGLDMEAFREKSGTAFHPSENDFCGIESEDRHYTPSSTGGDYGPGNPWDAPGMSIKDFI